MYVIKVSGVYVSGADFYDDSMLSKQKDRAQEYDTLVEAKNFVKNELAGVGSIYERCIKEELVKEKKVSKPKAKAKKKISKSKTKKMINFI